MKKVLLTATVQSHIAQFHKPLIDMLHEYDYEVHVAAGNNLSEKNGLQLETPDKIFDIPFDRSPLSITNVKAYKQLKAILAENEYDIIHCNTPVGGVVTRLAAREMRKSGTKVFYTAHGFHFYEGALLKNWILYYPVEKWLAHHTDKLITVSYEDYNLATKKKFRTDIVHIHGVGADTDKYFAPSNELIANLRLEEGYKNDDFICICTGELNRNKNQLTIVRAVPEIIRIIPDFILLLAGDGPKKAELKMFIENNSLQNNIKLLGYRTDLDRFVKLSNIAVSASIREGLPLNIIEAMLCGKPVIGSKNRGHNELIRHEENGLLVDAANSDGFVSAIIRLYKDNDLYMYMKRKSLELSCKYTRERVRVELENIYEI